MLVNEATIRKAEAELHADIQESMSRKGYDVAAPEHRTTFGQETMIRIAAKWLEHHPAVLAHELGCRVCPGRRKFANAYWLRHRLSDEPALFLGNGAQALDGAFIVAVHLAGFEMQCKRSNVSGRLILSARTIESICRRYSERIEIEGRKYPPETRP